VTSQFGLPIFILSKPSPWLAGCVIVIHLGAMIALFFADVHWLARYVVVLMITASLTHTLLTWILQKRPETPVRLLLTPAGEWWLTCVNGQTLAVQLLPAAYVHPLLTVLTFQSGEHRYRVILTPDVVDADMFRRLRVRLRFMHDRETLTGR
jgi:hypothetical protein